MFKTLALLLRNFTSFKIYFFLLRSYLLKNRLKKFQNKKIEFIKKIEGKTFTNDWFTHNIPSWLFIFKQCNLAKKNKLNILEIGSYEGMSTLFLLQSFPKLIITCVDIWGKSSKSIYQENYEKLSKTQKMKLSIEDRFDQNTKSFQKRIKKIRSSSLSFFYHHQKLNYYDLIYIDGSHYADDVIIDSILAFSLLKKNGILIFDDYLWWYYSNPRKNPSAAINLFLKLKADSLKIIFVGYQIAIQKKY